MNLFGIGVDIVDNSRIKKMIKNKNFLNRVFSKHEISSSINISNKIGDKAPKMCQNSRKLPKIGSFCGLCHQFHEIHKTERHFYM